MRTTMTYDAGRVQPIEPTESRATLTFDRAFQFAQQVNALEATVPGTCTTFSYDSAPHRILNANGPVTTNTYVDTARMSRETSHFSTHSIAQDPPEEISLVTRVREAIGLSKSTGGDLWWFIWGTILQHPWFLKVRNEIVAQHCHEVREVNQIITEDLAERLREDPMLELGPEEMPAELGTEIQRIIIRNVDEWRRRRRRENRRMSMIPIETVAGKSPSSVSDTIDINKALDGLAADERRVFEMRLDGYRRSDVADELHLSVFQVDRRNHAAKEKLRRELRDFQIE